MQTHHVSYEPEIVTKIFKGEHYIITLLNRRTKNVSIGFLHCLFKWIIDSYSKAVDLDNSKDELREIFREPYLEDIFDRRKGMLKLNKITILDYWENVYDGRFYFKISFKINFEDNYFLLSVDSDVFEKESFEDFFNKIDANFPNINNVYANAELEQIKSLKEVINA